MYPLPTGPVRQRDVRFGEVTHPELTGSTTTGTLTSRVSSTNERRTKISTSRSTAALRNRLAWRIGDPPTDLVSLSQRSRAIRRTLFAFPPATWPALANSICRKGDRRADR